MRPALLLLAVTLAGGGLLACGKGGGATTTIVRTTAGAATTPQQRSTSTSTPPPSTTPPGSGTTPPGSSTTPPSSGGSAPSRERALAFAHAVNLTAADVPGFTANEKQSHHSARERALEREMQRCAGIGGSSKGIAEASSKNFELKRQIIDLSVSSEVSVSPSAGDAARALSAIRSAHVRDCFSRFLGQIFKGERVKGATAGPITIQAGTPPAPGVSGSFGWRVTATFLVRGLKIPIYLDFLGFVVGPSEVTLLSTGVLQPFPAAIQQHLFSLLLSRAKAHPL